MKWLILAALASACTDHAKAAPPRELIEPVIAARMLSDYRENEVAADAKYRGKLVPVLGYVAAIQKDAGDHPLLVLDDGLRASFDHDDLLAQLHRGDHVSVRCVAEKVAGEPRLTHCALR